MKKRFVLFAVIVASIALFVIVARKGFNYYDDVQTFHSESPTLNMPPAVSVSETRPVTEMKSTAEAMPVEKKSADETKLAETKPVTEATIEAETNNAEIKSAEDKANADTNNLSSVDAPVITEEEALQANEDALKLSPAKEKSADTKIFSANSRFTRPKVQTTREIVKEALNNFLRKMGINDYRYFPFISLLPLLLIFDVLLFKKKKNKKCGKIAEYISLQRRVCILFSVSLLAFDLLVFVPWSVYFGNSLQISFIFKDFVNLNLLVLTVSIIGGSIVLLLIPPKISDYLVAIIAGLGLCVYAQAMFMNQNLRAMDGFEPVWSEHRIFGIFNLIVWVIILLVPIVLKRVIPSLFAKIISITTGIILFLELLATASMVISAGPNVWSHTDSYYINGSNQFQLSKEKNVVVFVMDMLDSRFTEKCFEIYPETKEIVKDFIWYKDARSNYTRTFPGLCHELTGSYLVLPVNGYKDLFERLWHSPSAQSFYKQMTEAGFDARIYVNSDESIFGPTEYYHDYFSNIEPGSDVSYTIDFARLCKCFVQMSGYSFSPYLAKHYFFYSFDFSDQIVQKKITGITSDPNNSIYDDNSLFLRKMISSGISTDANKPSLLFYYIIGTHIPWQYDEKSNRTEEPFDNPYPTTRGCFHILSEFIRLLKEKDIYDNTAILLCSDHGDITVGFSSYMTFMIKPFHENKPELSIDNSKVSSIDILPTLLAMACGEDADFKDFDGYPSFHIPNERIRKVYIPGYSKDFPVFRGWYSLNYLLEYELIGREEISPETFVRYIPFKGDKNP